jgi:hypothetical protein
MKKINFFALIALIVATASCNRVAPNYEGVLMQNYGQNGRSDYSTVTGNQGVLGMGSELFQVPMYEQTADVEIIKIMSKDNSEFAVDPRYTYEAIRGAGVDIIYNYRHVGATGDTAMMNNIESVVLNPLVLDAYRSIARTYKTDSLMLNMAQYEQQVEDTLKNRFLLKFFKLSTITSGLRPPQSTMAAIEDRNNAKIKAEQVENERKIALMKLENAKIEQQTNTIKSQGLTKEILQERFIDAIRNSSNRIIITDGKTPILINQ